jgi:hypothetical protein
MELKNSEMLRDRFELLSMAEEYAGKYVSVEYLRKNILQQTDEQIKEIDKQIASEQPEDDDEDDDDEDF